MYWAHAKGRSTVPLVDRVAHIRDRGHAALGDEHDRVRRDPRAEHRRTAQARGAPDHDRRDADASADLGSPPHHRRSGRHDNDRHGAHEDALVLNLQLLFAGQTIWIVARSTGVASLVALSISMLTGMALRPKSLTWLSTNRALSELHSYATVLWLPFAIAHVVAILLDPYAKVGLVDLVVPFFMSYGTFAIGLGTLSVQMLVVVTIAALSRSKLSRGEWLAFHRLSYVAFAAAFLHGVLSGTDLAYPWLAGIAWLVAAILVIVGWRRVAHAVSRLGQRPMDPSAA